MQCGTFGCCYAIHSNKKNNGGTHCCYGCKNTASHGPLCEKKLLSNQQNLLIVGAGGNGQTYFMQFLEKNGLRINAIHDRDKLKHLSSPAMLNIKVDKCIFLYNDPMSAILSHYRRALQMFQIKKLGDPYELTQNTPNLSSYINLVIQKEKDLFGIEYQFDNWITAQTSFPVLFVDFNEVLDKKDIIDSFVGKKLDYSIFKNKNRHTYSVDIPQKFRDIYNKLYEKFREEILKRETLDIHV